MGHYSVVLTFDDGFRNFLTVAAPILAERKIPATVFLITDKASEEGLKQLVDYAPDLVVLDLQMPVMDGWHFRAAQRTLPNIRMANVPVLLLTGTGNAARSAEALQAAGFIEKPFEPDLLLGAALAALTTTAQRGVLDRRVKS